MVSEPVAMGLFAKDSEWLTDHYEDIKDSGNKVVAIKDGQVIHEGETMEDVLRELENRGEDLAYILVEVIPSDDVSFIL